MLVSDPTQHNERINIGARIEPGKRQRRQRGLHPRPGRPSLPGWGGGGDGPGLGLHLATIPTGRIHVRNMCRRGGVVKRSAIIGGGTVQRPRLYHVPKTRNREPGQVGGTKPLQRHQGKRGFFNNHAHAGGATKDQENIAQHANSKHNDQTLTLDALTDHQGVLRANGNNERKTQEETSNSNAHRS